MGLRGTHYNGPVSQNKRYKRTWEFPAIRGPNVDANIFVPCYKDALAGIPILGNSNLGCSFEFSGGLSYPKAQDNPNALYKVFGPRNLKTCESLEPQGNRRYPRAKK